MRVLVVSHTVFSSTESMGKTLISYFGGFEKDELAQFYIHSQVPTSDICEEYYRITDKEAIKSIVGFKPGKIFTEADVESWRINARTDTGVTSSLYQKARKRTPFIYFARNIWWSLARWNNKKLNNWLNKVKPDCVFFAAGDYAFMYDIARKIAQSRNIPLYVSCMDDFYFYNRNEDSFLGRIYQAYFMKHVRKTMAYAAKIFCICEKMSSDYSKLFGKTCVTIHTPSSIQRPLQIEKKDKISYLGNLGYQRYKQLIEIGKALKRCNLQPNHIDVYSSESRKEILDEMTENNGIHFHGSVGAEEVLQVIGESLAVIHTESFVENTRKCVKYSISTKIADSLASGTCIFAYGPEDIASMEYLKKNNAACCCFMPEKLQEDLKRMIKEKKFRDDIEISAVNLARKNHQPYMTPKILRQTFKEANGM